MSIFLAKIKAKLYYILNDGKASFSLRTVIYNILLLTITIIILCISLYYFLSPYSIVERIIIIVNFIVSALISNFFLNKFQYSNYTIVRMLQKFIFLNLFIVFTLLTLDFFGIVNFHIFCDPAALRADGDISSSDSTNNSSTDKLSVKSTALAALMEKMIIINLRLIKK